MLTLRRAAERRHERREGNESWRTFGPRDDAAAEDGFGALELFDEERLLPGGRLARSTSGDGESVCYVRTGALAYDDSLGRSGVLQAGQFLRRTARQGVDYNQRNASRTDATQVFQVRLHAAGAGLEPRHEVKRFTVAERRGSMCVVASIDERRGSLRMRQDATLLSAILAPGQHVIHELAHGRSAWLHIVAGEVGLGDLVLSAGDGVGLENERAVSFTAREPSEVLLMDLGEHGAPR